MKRIFFLFLLVFLVPVSSGAQEPKLQKSVLKNGLTLVAREQSGDLAAACLFVRVSARDEQAGKRGLTDIVGRVLLSCDPLGKGASSVLMIEQLGGSVFADTEEDFTVFTLSVPSKNFGKAVKAFSEIFISPDFSGSALSREKEGAAASWLRHSDKIDERVCREVLFKGRGGNNLPDMQSFTAETVGAWYSKYYRPFNMVLSVCGPNAAGMLKAAGDAFGRYLPPEPSAASSASRNSTGAKPAAEKVKAEKDKREAVGLGYPMPPAGSADYPAMLIAKALIASGTGSGMFAGLRGPEGISYLFGSRLECSNSDPRLVFFAVPDTGKSGEARQKLLMAVNAVTDDRITQQAFERAKEYAKGELLTAESTRGRAWTAGYYEMAGLGPDYGEKLLPLLEKTGRQDAVRAAARYLGGGSMVKLPAAADSALAGPEAFR